MVYKLFLGMSLESKVFYADIFIIGEFGYLPSPVFVDGVHDGFLERNRIAADLFNLVVFINLDSSRFDVGGSA